MNDDTTQQKTKKRLRIILKVCVQRVVNKQQLNYQSIQSELDGGKISHTRVCTLLETNYLFHILIG